MALLFEECDDELLSIVLALELGAVLPHSEQFDFFIIPPVFDEVTVWNIIEKLKTFI